MRRRTLLTLACLAAMQPAVLAQPAPDEAARVASAFKAAAKRSLGPRSGDLFALPAKHNYIIESAYIRPHPTTIERGGKVERIQTSGNHHGTLWDHDVRIPLAFYGPGVAHAGKRVRDAATQQDIVPTLARVLGVLPPEDARGRVLDAALKRDRLTPKAVLVLVFDQGGMSMLEAHPGRAPFIDSLMARGTRFDDARVTHLDPETVVGHAAIGTGAYPAETGVGANRPWTRHAGAARMAVAGESGPSPLVLESPTLADVWLAHTRGKALVIAQSLADRAAIGMVGHGAWYGSNPKPIVNFFDERKGEWTTHGQFFAQPDYVKAIRPEPYWKSLGPWRGHTVADATDMRISPAGATFDGDTFMAMLEREPIGADDTPDLLFWSLKSTDYVAHRYGMESLEARDTLAEQDRQARRAVEHLERKVGKDRLLVVFTADHGGAPLVELTGGSRMAETDVLRAINARFDKRDNGVPVAEHVTSTQLFLHDLELAANGATIADVKAFLKGFKVNGKPFFATVLTREDVLKN